MNPENPESKRNLGAQNLWSNSDIHQSAIEISNNTVYGLGSYVQTNDGEKANRVARKLRSGMVTMNGVSRVPGQPCGGYKQSGIGRDNGYQALENYLQVKSTWIKIT